jgi:hypothetical protein
LPFALYIEHEFINIKNNVDDAGHEQARGDDFSGMIQQKRGLLGARLTPR